MQPEFHRSVFRHITFWSVLLYNYLVIAGLPFLVFFHLHNLIRWCGVRAKPATWVLIFIFSSTIVIGLLNNLNFASLKATIILVLGLIFLNSSYLIFSKLPRERTYYLLRPVGFIIVLWAAFEVVTGYYLFESAFSTAESAKSLFGMNRPMLFFYNTNNFAYFLVGWSLITIMFYRNRIDHILCLGYAFLCIFTLSRGAAAAFVLLYSWLWLNLFFQRPLIAFNYTLLFALFVKMIGPSFYQSRYRSIFDIERWTIVPGSITNRVDIYLKAIYHDDVWSFFLGRGAGQTEFVLGASVHSFVFEIFADYGLLGVLCLGLFFFKGLSKIVSVPKLNRDIDITKYIMVIEVMLIASFGPSSVLYASITWVFSGALLSILLRQNKLN